jgi:GDP-4-dehydro-6-deoxy-D-mannose reductase
VSVREIADLLLARAHRPIRLVTDPDLVRPVEVPRLVGSSELLRSVTGWKPEIPLEETLTDVLETARADL